MEDRQRLRTETCVRPQAKSSFNCSAASHEGRDDVLLTKVSQLLRKKRYKWPRLRHLLHFLSPTPPPPLLRFLSPTPPPTPLLHFLSPTPPPTPLLHFLSPTPPPTPLLHFLSPTPPPTPLLLF
ncbi:hypothetical protein INR49_006752, partial [Caranx melampygus]